MLAVDFLWLFTYLITDDASQRVDMCHLITAGASRGFLHTGPPASKLESPKLKTARKWHSREAANEFAMEQNLTQGTSQRVIPGTKLHKGFTFILV